jgi:hypothetical protein
LVPSKKGHAVNDHSSGADDFAIVGTPVRWSRRRALAQLGRSGGVAVLGTAGAAAIPAAVRASDDEESDEPDDAPARPEVLPATRESLPESTADSGGSIRYLTDEDRSLWLDNGQGWFSLGGEVFNVRAFGAKGDGTSDDWGAFHAAIDAMTSVLEADSTSPYGRTLYVPPGTYRLAQTLVLDRAVRLVGASTGGAYGDSVIQVDAGIVGIIVGAAEPGITGQPGRRGDGSIIERIRIETASGAGGTQAAENHGIWMRARATVRDCQIGGFGGNGINVEAAADEGDATGWVVEATRVQRCGGNGLRAGGTGADGGTCVALSAVGNGGWAVADEETRGNTYLQCRADGNGRGAFTTTGEANRGVFVGCVSESGQGRSVFAAGTIVVGGDHRAGYEGGNAWVTDGARMTLLAQDPGGGETAMPTAPTLLIQGTEGQTQPHVRVTGDAGEQQLEVDGSGRLFLGPIGPETDAGGTAEAAGLLLQIGHPVSGMAGIRWIAAGDAAGWVAQARAYREEAGSDAQESFAQGRLTFQTPDATGTEIDTLTLRQGAVGIGTTQPAALLHLESTASGFLPPRMTGEQRDAIPAPPEGLVVYNVETHRLNLFVGDTWREVALAPVGG